MAGRLFDDMCCTRKVALVNNYHQGRLEYISISNHKNIDNDISGEHDDRVQSLNLRGTKHPLELRPGLHDGPELQQRGSHFSKKQKDNITIFQVSALVQILIEDFAKIFGPDTPDLFVQQVVTKAMVLGRAGIGLS